MLRCRCSATLRRVGRRACSQFAPNPAGTLMPDGSRWGAFSPSDVHFDDPHSVFASHELEILVSGVRWSEGPMWVSHKRALYFDSPIDAKIYKWREGEGTSVVASESGGYDGSNVENYSQLFEPGANGMALAGDDVVICQHPTRRVIRMKLDALANMGGAQMCTAAFDIVAEAAANGRPLNAPNDVIVAPDGDIYFTDPVYGFLLKQPAALGYSPLGQEKGEPTDQPYLDEMVQRVGAGLTGVYRVRDGVVSLVTDALTRPNGLALSPDGQTLWVANSDKDAPSWHAFSMGESLPLARTRVLSAAELGPGVVLGPGLSDGFKIDTVGRLWASVPGGLAVIDPDKPAVLATCSFGTNTSNVALSEDGDVFVTGLGHVWRLRRSI